MVATVAGPGLLAVSPAAARPAPKPGAATGDLTAAAGAGASVSFAGQGGPVQFVGVPNGQSIAVDGATGGPGTVADAFVSQYGGAFGEPSPDRDLAREGATPMAAGGKSVRYQQLDGGVPVLAAELRVQVTGSGSVVSAGGELSTKASVDPSPEVSTAAARAAAVGSVADARGLDESTLSASPPALWVYDPSLIGEPSAPSRLVWRLEVTGDGTVPVRELVLVDAVTGTLALQIDLITPARTRRVCDNQNVAGASYSCPAPGARAEGQGPTGIGEVDKAYDLSGLTYDFYQSRFGRDSINGSGLPLISTVRHCPDAANCPYANAFWDGSQMVYGDTFAGADDVVAHELTHGVTEYTSGLVYLNQSGAINESLSDVFGEYMDLTDGTGNDAASVRWDMGEDLPIGALRDMADPGRFGDPDKMSSPNYYNGTADSGGVHTNSGVNNKAAALMVDGGTFNGRTITGLGITKAARIYYETQTTLLGSGSDYTALGDFLPQACANAVGVDGITAADCTQVSSIVAATEMVQPAPANDAFSASQALGGASGTTSGTTVGATKETGEPSHAGNAGGGSIWYRFTAASSGPVTINTTGSGFDTLLGVYTGAAVSGLTAVASNDDNPAGGLQSLVSFSAVAGTTYRIAVDGYSGVKGAVTLNWTVPAVPAPVNDAFSASQALAGASGTTNGTTVGATKETGEPSHAGEAGGGSIWYRFTAPTSGATTINTTGSGFDTLLGVYTGASVTGLTEVASNDDNPAGGFQSLVSFSAVAGTTYRIAVDGYSGVKGAVTLTWAFPAAPLPTGVSGTVTETGSGAPVAGAWVAVLRAADFSVAGGATADAGGNYSALVAAGSYYLYVIDPSGAHASSFFGAPTTVTVTTGSMVDKDPALASTRGSVTGTVVEDATGTPVGGAWAVALNASTGEPETGVVANASGQFTLSGLTAGNHLMVYFDPTGAHATEFYANSSTATGATPVVVPGGGSTVANDSMAPQTITPGSANLSGVVTETGTNSQLGGVFVIALRAADFRLASAAVTNASGAYSLNVQSGAYKLGFLDRAGRHSMEWHLNQPSSGIANAASVSAPAVVNAALDTNSGSMAGTITDDPSGTPIPGAWVLAIGPNGVAGGAITAANGTYTLAGLPAGVYRAVFIDPSGSHVQEYWSNSPTYAGANPISIAAGAATAISAAVTHT